MKIYSYKAEDLAVFANQVKENLLVSLENDGVLEDGKGVELATTYIINVGERKDTWGTWIAQKLGFDDDGVRMVVSKLVERPTGEEQSEEEPK